VTVESAWRAHAVSPVGALGYGQLMPGTAAGLDVDALEPYENLDGTARYLRRMLNRYRTSDPETRMRLALASYNAGPYAVARFHGVPPYRETIAYVDNVLRTRASFVAAVATRAPYDVASLVAERAMQKTAHRVAIRNPAAPSARPSTGAHHARPGATVLAWKRAAMYHSPPFGIARPPRIAAAAPPPVRYETSRSFFARVLGLRHRIPAPTTVAAEAAPPPLSDYTVTLPFIP
jgi:hypothetical protein